VNQEHAAFLRSLNKLHSAMIQGKEKSVTGPLLRELPASVRDHFATEESLMKSTNYPRLAEHRARHEEFTRQLNEFVTLLERGDRGLSILLLVSMREHISAHIQKDDQAYVPWLTEQWGAVSLSPQRLLSAKCMSALFPEIFAQLSGCPSDISITGTGRKGDAHGAFNLEQQILCKRSIDGQAAHCAVRDVERVARSNDERPGAKSYRRAARQTREVYA
jgi:hemerythrin